MSRLVLSLAVLCAASAAAGAALVPAPREWTAREGVCAVSIPLAWSKWDWWDQDIVGDCLAAAKTEVTTDASLPKEGYWLVVRPTGIAIAASDAAGAFYARQTLRQLARQTASNAIEIACCEIRDWPAYPYRGMLVDEGRHFLGKTVVKRQIELMAGHKLNVLHWHLTEDMGWRLELKRHPELVRVGAVRSQSAKFGTNTRWLPPLKKAEDELDGERYGPFYYTQDDVREILAYAKAHHVTVVPEIELPGHCRALLAAHPELSCTGDVPREPCFGPTISKDVICVGNDAAVRLYEEIFDEVCELFPDAPYVHIGGDECPRDRWRACAKCQARIRAEGLKGEDGLQAWICTRMVRHLERRGRRAIGWDEILSGDVPASAVGMVWRSSAAGGAGTAYTSAVEAVRRGHDLVMAPKIFCYFSQPQFASGDPYPYHGPWGAPLTLEKAYSFNPSDGIPATAPGRVLGSTACLWGEQIWTRFDFEWKAWPRTCAFAEALWLGTDRPGFADFRRRMERHRARLIAGYVNCAPL